MRRRMPQKVPERNRTADGIEAVLRMDGQFFKLPSLFNELPDMGAESKQNYTNIDELQDRSMKADIFSALQHTMGG